jgi:hypothetical protein
MLGKARTFKNQSKRFQGLVSNFSPKRKKKVRRLGEKLLTKP